MVVPTPAEVHAHYANQEANILINAPAAPTEKSFQKLLFMPNRWARPYVLAAQTPYQAFCMCDRRSWQQCPSWLIMTTRASLCWTGSGQFVSAQAMETCNARDCPSPSSGAVSSPTEASSDGEPNAWLRSAFQGPHCTPTGFHPSHQAPLRPKPRYQKGESSRPRKTVSLTQRRPSSRRTHAHPSMN